MPTVQHLLNGNLDALREAIQDALTEEEPTRWVVSHIILGSALRLRAAHATDDERARMYPEALRAFDTALAACCETKQAQTAAPASAGGKNPAAHTEYSGPDGVQLTLDGANVPVAEGNALLERAVHVFRDACATTQSAWFVGMSNLGCALTLLGRRTPGMAGVTILEEALDVMHEALRMPPLEGLAAERATTQVNLADALHALAERGMPSESLRYLEDATHWQAAALCYFAPPEYRWLLQLDRGTTIS
jgi:hypothetical protein